jgi:hypothetical protein
MSVELIVVLMVPTLVTSTANFVEALWAFTSPLMVGLATTWGPSAPRVHTLAWLV